MAKKRNKKKATRSVTTRKKDSVKTTSPDNLLGELRSLIEESRAATARSADHPEWIGGRP